MNAYNFIFSDQPRQRISRHIAFWFVFWIFFLFSSYIPYCVFPGWDTSPFAPNVARIGLTKWLLLRFINSTIALIPLMTFGYAIVYFLLPVFFSRKKNLLPSFCIFVVIVAAIYWLQLYSWYVVAVINTWFNPAKKVPGINTQINHTSKFVISNYPVVAGLMMSVKLLKHWWFKQKEANQIYKEKTSAQLQLLKARIHPHFLFNSLNNVYSYALEGSAKTPEMIRRLSDLLHYMLNDCKQDKVSLKKELKMIMDYIELEKTRYSERLKLKVSIRQQANDKMIAPLLLIPFVENSFKHGASNILVNPEVSLDIYVIDETLHFKLINNLPSEKEKISVNGNGGLGLENVKKRLALLYPGRHELMIKKDAECFSVVMKIELAGAVNYHTKEVYDTEITTYELA